MAQDYGHLANAEKFEQKPCLVCDDPAPTYSWTDYSGEGYCVKCGTPYQLKWGELKDGETYPRINVNDVWLPILRKFWSEKFTTNGCGTFMVGDQYGDQMAGRRVFNEWCKEHEAELPKKSEA